LHRDVVIGCCASYNVWKPVLFPDSWRQIMPIALTVLLGETETAALDRHIAAHRPGHTREEMMAEIVARWLEAQQPATRAHPDEGLRPEELNASNDS